MSERVTIDSSVTTIGEYVFGDCTSLASILIQGVTTIDVGAFIGCTNLASIETPGGVTLGRSSFHECTYLASIVIPQGVATIGDGAFRFCTLSLYSITSFLLRHLETV